MPERWRVVDFDADAMRRLATVVWIAIGVAAPAYFETTPLRTVPRRTRPHVDKRPFRMCAASTHALLVFLIGGSPRLSVPKGNVSPT